MVMGSSSRITVQLYKVRPLRAAARCTPERGGAGHMTVVEKRAVHGQH